MKITIILNEPYPYGMACTNRIHLYAKRFKEQGHDVEIIIPKPTESHHTQARNTEIEGEYEGVKFRYPLNPVRSTSFLKRRINDVLAYFKTLSYVLKNKRDTDIVLLVVTKLYMVVTYKLFCLLVGSKLIWEKSEFPFVFAKKTPLNQFYHKIYAKFGFKLFDGILLISDSLFEYFKGKVGKKTKLIVIPILTDTSVFTPTKNNSGEIVYAGALNQFKDGIMDLLKAYSIFSGRMPGKKLVLMGDINLSSNKNEINSFISEHRLANEVEITGYVSRPEMIRRMSNAAVLALAKPSNLQSEHCVPTKIAEYLSTGKPVLATNTGSIPKFLTNKKDSYLTEPNNPEQLAETLFNIYSDYPSSEAVGKKGRILAQDQFEYTKQGDRIISFFNDILTTNGK